MLHEPIVVHSESARDSTAHVVHAMMHFLMAVRYRRNVVLTAMLAAVLLGGLYYATATRYYGSRAEVLVMRTGPDMAPSMSAEASRQQNLMPTFESLFTSAKVVEGALKHLRQEDRIDLAGAPENCWAAILKQNLSASMVRGTNIIEIGYRSKDPRAAASVVGAVVQSYVEFLDQTHRGTSGEIIRVLTKEKGDLAEKLVRKEQELLEARRQFGDLGIRSDSKLVHPLVQQAMSFNESLIEARKRRIELEASLAAIQAAIRRGEDLQQHMMSVANAVGGEILLTSLGISRGDSYALADLERRLLEDRAELKTMQEHLGPAHPEVVEKQDRIRMTEQYLLGYQERVSQRLSQLQNHQLGPMLVQMVQQKLAETWQLEASLRQRFEEAKEEAVEFNGQLARLEIIEHDLQWLRNLHDVLLNHITNIDLKNEGGEVRTAVIQEPQVIDSPVVPNLRRVALTTLLAGLLAGLAAVYVLDTLDDRFRSVEELQSQLRVPVLAMVRQIKPADAGGVDALQVHVAPNAPESEAFRTLRTALALADRQARRIVVSSAEPGDGKTTVLANLAACCAQFGRRTLLIDADLRRPGLTALLGLRGVEGLSSVLRGEGPVAKTAETCIRPSGIEGLDVLASGPRPSNPAELLAHPRFSELLAWAETVYDEILIDSPPALAASDAAVIGRLVDGLMLVVQPEKNRRRQVIRAAESLVALKIPLLGVVLNRLGADGDRGYYGYGSGFDYEAGDADPPGDAFDPASDAPGAADRPSQQGAESPGVVPRRVA